MASQPVEVWAFGLFGLAVLALVAASLREAAAMKRWPVAKGRVLSSKVEEFREVTASRSTGGSSRMTLYRPEIAYEYEVAGQRLRGDRVAQSPGMDRGVATFAEAIAQRYPAGAGVDVRFNPARPGESVLEPRVPLSWIAGLVLGLVLVALAISRAHFG